MTERVVRGLAIACGVAVVLGGSMPRMAAQPGQAPVPYKLGTFERSGHAFVGLVLDDTRAIDITQANAALEAADASAAKMTPPADMKDLIARYEDGWRTRLGVLARQLARPQAPPAYSYEIASLEVLPPVRPAVLLNAGGNYVEHTEGIAQQQARVGGAPAGAPPPKPVTVPGIWERPADDTRDNPYLFLKSPTVVVGAFDPIVIPRGRTRIDFECEFVVVVGKTAKHVPLAQAADHIFGYTIQIDVSDRGGRGDRKMGGSDWLVGKNHDTFGPLGPFIVPKAFLKDPMNTRHTFTLNDTVMQDSNTSRMSHNIHELLHYASNILTLNPGDAIAGGSPAGTNIERAEPRWMRPGDTAVCAIEGIGTQRHAVVAGT